MNTNTLKCHTTAKRSSDELQKNKYCFKLQNIIIELYIFYESVNGKLNIW